jgi:hypothetical protein
LYRYNQVSYEQLLRVRMCNTQFPAEVAIYEKDYVAVTDAATWRNDTKYEVRLEYYMVGLYKC